MSPTAQLIVLFILLALGYAGCKLKALPPETGKVLTKLVFTITLPATILSSVTSGSITIQGSDAALFILKVLLVYLIFMAIAIPSSRLLSTDQRTRGMLSFMLIFGNVAFMGLPVTAAIFGDRAIFYVALAGLPFWLASFSLGMSLVAGKKEKFDPKTLITPVFIASILLIPLALANLRIPVIISEAIGLTGSITTPASMLIIGATLAQAPIKNVFTDWRLYPLAFIKLVIIPLAVWLILRIFVTDELILGVLVIISAMPTAAIAAMFAIEHNNNETMASGGVFLTTLFSAITIPLIVHLLLR